MQLINFIDRDEIAVRKYDSLYDVERKFMLFYSTRRAKKIYG